MESTERTCPRCGGRLHEQAAGAAVPKPATTETLEAIQARIEEAREQTRQSPSLERG